ncbi:hypothetical protein L3V79_05225 [Thiotrichales bacterium 19S9-12]|nr:hypothetical protein [Thiotrichales bacterium 19S9-11]MCF6811760.1 hypothetical protein [Thiotrichales bacterium 19S9-12]
MDTIEMTEIMPIKSSLKNELENFQQNIINQLHTYTEKEPEITFTWKDDQSEAKGYLVINSLKGDACGGGTRVHETVTVDEVTTLAKIMEIKFALSGPAIGGAKSGIALDPNHPNKYEVLARWYKAISPLLKECYGTGSDLNTDIHKINDILKELGINNSQAGIIHAVTQDDENKKKQAYENMKLIRQPVNLTDNLTIPLSELTTGYGVYASVDSYLKLNCDTIKDKRIFIQGVGNVGAATLWYLYQAGAKIIALSDSDGGMIFKESLSEFDIFNVLEHKKLSKLDHKLLDHKAFNQGISSETLDIFIPAAGSNLNQQDFIENMHKQGLSLIACGANHPFVETEYCYGKCSQILDRKLTVIPDFLANMGMARTFYYLMSQTDSISESETKRVFDDIYQEIYHLMKEAYTMNSGKLMTATLYQIALDKINQTQTNFV